MPIQPHTVGIVVKDMSAALAFYRTLGLETAEGEEHSPHVGVPVAAEPLLARSTWRRVSVGRF